MRIATGLSLMGVLVACTEPAPGGPGVSSRVGIFEYPVGGRGRLDVLVVVDDSTTMAPYREQVVADLPELATVLGDLLTGMPDVNIAVTTTNASAGGALRTTASVDGSYIIDGMRDGVRTVNYTGELGVAIGELVDFGAGGTAPVQPLDVIPQALANPGFLRDHAYLLLAIVAATDDASSVAVDAAVSSLKAMKADPTNVIVTGIYPQDAPRLDGFLTMFPNRSTFTPIDADDFTTAFAMIAQLQRTTLGVPCVEFTPLDVDPETAGDQYDCNVEDRRVAEGTQRLPRCEGANQPCWDFVADPMNCMTGNSLSFRVDRGTAGQPYDGSVIRGECLVE